MQFTQTFATIYASINIHKNGSPAKAIDLYLLLCNAQSPTKVKLVGINSCLVLFLPVGRPLKSYNVKSPAMY